MENTDNNLVYRLRKRAEIRRSITNRKSVQNNEPDRISDLLEEAANHIEDIEKSLCKLGIDICENSRDTVWVDDSETVLDRILYVLKIDSNKMSQSDILNHLKNKQ